MPLSDLLGKRARTASGVEVATPTVRSFFRALEAFGAEIGVLRSAVRSVQGGLSADIAISLFLATPEDGRLEYVIGTSDPEAARLVAEMVAPLAARIDEMLGDPEADSVEEDDDVDGGVLYVFGVAERFHIDPMMVMDWPLGTFLDATKAYSRPARTQPATPEMIGSIMPTITAEEAGEAPQAAN